MKSQKLIEYELEKAKIARTAVSAAEYERRIAELVKRLKI